MNLANNKWQVSVWFDPAYAPGNQDDFMDGSTFLNVSDWLPNAGVVTGIDAGNYLTFCESNTDYDNDVDAEDGTRFKSDFGRSLMKNPCPHCR